ncbi:hypothetical protein [Dokdonella koreensis]|uniref:hypothetical protein n=1 Tax=Dokdonella koreensis TaxID=323415 RepID=UPI0012378EBE|nr:hypothetical protein [Dokdonella koreensis]
MAIALLSGAGSATTQLPERVIIDGETAWIELATPLAAYWNAEPDRFAAVRRGIRSTALYRGYRGTWEIAGGRLWLRKIEIDVEHSTDGKIIARDVIREVFPSGIDPVASWYSGTLIIPRGPIARFDRIEQEALFERYTLIRIADGRVERRLDMEGEAFVTYREAQFQAFKRTRAYQQAFEKARERTVDQMIDPQLFDSQVDSYLTLNDPPAVPATTGPAKSRSDR